MDNNMKSHVSPALSSCWIILNAVAIRSVRCIRYDVQKAKAKLRPVEVLKSQQLCWANNSASGSWVLV